MAKRKKITLLHFLGGKGETTHTTGPLVKLKTFKINYILLSLWKSIFLFRTYHKPLKTLSLVRLHRFQELLNLKYFYMQLSIKHTQMHALSPCLFSLTQMNKRGRKKVNHETSSQSQSVCIIKKAYFIPWQWSQIDFHNFPALIYSLPL